MSAWLQTDVSTNVMLERVHTVLNIVSYIQQPSTELTEKKKKKGRKKIKLCNQAVVTDKSSMFHNQRQFGEILTMFGCTILNR